MAASDNGLSQYEANRNRGMLQKIVETGFLIATWLALGLYLEIFGPTQKDLKIKLDSSYEDVAFAVSGRAVGLFPGCVIGGFLVDKFEGYCHLMIALCLDIAGAVTIAIPWCSNLDLVWALCFFGGLVESVINVAGQRIILNIWREKSAGPLHILHMGYGIGSFIIPLYTNPYLAILREDTANTTVTDVFQNSSYMSTTHPGMTDMYNSYTMDHGMNGGYTSTPEPETLYERTTRIEYPYAISGSLVAGLSLVFFIYQIQESLYRKQYRAEQEKSAQEKVPTPSFDLRESVMAFLKMINPASCAGGDLTYGIQLFGLAIFYFANCHGGERVISGFIRSFSIDQLDFSNDEASLINTTFWISFTLGRFVFFILARFISIRIIIWIETGMVTIISILLNIFATDNKLAYWILMQPLGFFLAPLWPSGVGWSDYHVELSGVAMGLFILGGSIGGIVHLRLIGYLYDHVSHRAFLYQVLGYAIFALVIASLLNFIGFRHGSRFDKTKEDEEVDTKHSGVVDSKTANGIEMS